MLGARSLAARLCPWREAGDARCDRAGARVGIRCFMCEGDRCESVPTRFTGVLTEPVDVLASFYASPFYGGRSRPRLQCAARASDELGDVGSATPHSMPPRLPIWRRHLTTPRTAYVPLTRYVTSP